MLKIFFFNQIIDWLCFKSYSWSFSLFILLNKYIFHMLGCIMFTTILVLHLKNARNTSLQLYCKFFINSQWLKLLLLFLPFLHWIRLRILFQRYFSNQHICILFRRSQFSAEIFNKIFSPCFWAYFITIPCQLFSNCFTWKIKTFFIFEFDS